MFGFLNQPSIIFLIIFVLILILVFFLVRKKLPFEKNLTTIAKQDLHNLQSKWHIIKKWTCNKEQTQEWKEREQNNQPLPPNVFKCRDLNGDTIYYGITEDKTLTEQEKLQYIMLLQLEKITTIKIIMIVVLIAEILGGLIIYAGLGL